MSLYLMEEELQTIAKRMGFLIANSLFTTYQIVPAKTQMGRYILWAS